MKIYRATYPSTDGWKVVQGVYELMLIASPNERAARHFAECAEDDDEVKPWSDPARTVFTVVGHTVAGVNPGVLAAEYAGR